MADDSATELPFNAPPLARRLGVLCLVGLGLSIVDSALTVVGLPSSPEPVPLAAGVALVFASWALASVVIGILALVGLRITVGSARLEQLTQKLPALISKLAQERRGAAVLGLVRQCLALGVGAVTFLAGSVATFSHLITHRHGAILIAVTGVCAQAVLLVFCVGLASALTRFLGSLERRLPEPKRLSLRPLRALAVLLVLLLGMASVLSVRSWSLVQAVDGLSWLLLGAFLLLGPIALFVFRRARPRAFHRWLLPWLLPGSLGLLYAAAQLPEARWFITQSQTAKYFYALLLSASDVDRDASPSFPFAQDCAPFDGERHPLAIEVPGNQIDENCDDSDEIVALSSARSAPTNLPPGDRPNLVLITFDATRADHMGFMGYSRKTTPHLDELAERSVIFERAFSQDSGTGPSLWSLMAGKTPFQVKLQEAHRFPPVIDQDEQLLAEILRDAGYRTQAVLCGDVFDARHWNLRRGFQSYRNVCGRRQAHLAPIVTRAAKRALSRLSKREPFFLWVHYYDPHGPYTDHPSIGFGDHPMDNYDEELRYTDEHLGELLAAIRALSDKRPLYLAMSADHGEAFGEHGAAPHARNLYYEVTHVPLLIAGPRVQARRIAAPVAVNDLYPTFLHLARVEVPTPCTMTSQAGVLFGDAPRRGVIFQENSYSRPRRHTKGAIIARYQLIKDLTTGLDELYNYEDDPRETRNLIGTGLAAEAQLRSALQSFLPSTHVPENLSR